MFIVSLFSSYLLLCFICCLLLFMCLILVVLIIIADVFVVCFVFCLFVCVDFAAVLNKKIQTFKRSITLIFNRRLISTPYLPPNLTPMDKYKLRSPHDSDFEDVESVTNKAMSQTIVFSVSLSLCFCLCLFLSICVSVSTYLTY